MQRVVNKVNLKENKAQNGSLILILIFKCPFSGYFYAQTEQNWVFDREIANVNVC